MSGIIKEILLRVQYKHLLVKDTLFLLQNEANYTQNVPIIITYNLLLYYIFYFVACIKIRPHLIIDDSDDIL